MGAVASVLIASLCAGLAARKAAAALMAVAVSSAMLYLPFSWSMPAPIVVPAYGPHILYVMLGDPATTLCGILDGVDANGSPVSGAIYCNGDHVPPDDPRFPRTRRTMRSWT